MNKNRHKCLMFAVPRYMLHESSFYGHWSVSQIWRKWRATWNLICISGPLYQIMVLNITSNHGGMCEDTKTIMKQLLELLIFGTEPNVILHTAATYGIWTWHQIRRKSTQPSQRNEWWWMQQMVQKHFYIPRFHHCRVRNNESNNSHRNHMNLSWRRFYQYRPCFCSHVMP